MSVMTLQDCSHAGLLRTVAERRTTGWQFVRQQLHQRICRDSCLHVCVFRYAEVSLQLSTALTLQSDPNKVSPRGRGETICPPPMAVRLAEDLRPSADGSAVRTWLSCRQPACLQPRAAARLEQLRHGTDRRTYRRTDRGVA